MSQHFQRGAARAALEPNVSERCERLGFGLRSYRLLAPRQSTQR